MERQFGGLALARRPHPFGSSTVRRRSGTVCPPSGGLAPCPPPSLPASARPLVVSPDEDLLDDLLRLLAAAGAEPELAAGGPALRRAHRDAPLVLVGADALAAARSGPLPRRPGVVVVAARRAARRRVGGGRRARRRARGGAARRRGLAAGPRRPRRSARRSSAAGCVAVGGSCGGCRAPARWPTALALAAAPGVRPRRRRRRGAAGSTCCWAPSGPRACAGPSSPGSAAGSPAMRCWPRCPRSAACTCSPPRGAAPGPVPDEALTAVVEAARSVGLPGRGRPAPAGAGRGAAAVLADADLAVLVVPGAAAGGHRGAAARGRARARRGRRRSWSSGRCPAACPGTRSPTSSAGRCSAELPHDRSAVPRGERGEPPAVSPRSPARGGSPAGSSPSCRRRRAAGGERARRCWTGCAPGWRWSRAPPTPGGVAALVREESRRAARGRRRAARRPRRGRRARRGRSAGAAAARARASPTCWSTAPTRCGSTAAPGLELGGGALRRRRRRPPARRPAGRRGRPAAGRRRALGRRRPARRHPPARRAAAGVGQRAPACRCGCCAGARTASTTCAALGTLPGESAALLRALVAARLAFLVTGGTGSGKTTLLSALLGVVGPGRPDRARARTPPSCARRTRTSSACSPARPTSRASAQVTLRDLVRQALRMRPDRLVVGEVRGAEVGDLLAALNTGHDGGCGTLHANRPAEVPARLEALGVAGRPRPRRGAQPGGRGPAVVVHLRRTPAGRRVDEIGVLRRSGTSSSWSRAGAPTAARARPRTGCAHCSTGRRPGDRRPARCGAALLLWPDRRAARRSRLRARCSRGAAGRAGPVRGGPRSRRSPAAARPRSAAARQHAAGRRCSPRGSPRRRRAVLGRGAGGHRAVRAGSRSSRTGSARWPPTCAAAGRSTPRPPPRCRLRGRASAAGRWPARVPGPRGRPPAAGADDGLADALGRIAAAVRLSTRTGCSLAACASAVEDDLRARRRHRAELRAATAGPGPARCCSPACRCSGWPWAAGSAPIRGGSSPTTGTGQVLLVAGRGARGRRARLVAPPGRAGAPVTRRRRWLPLLARWRGAAALVAAARTVARPPGAGARGRRRRRPDGRARGLRAGGRRGCSPGRPALAAGLLLGGRGRAGRRRASSRSAGSGCCARPARRRRRRSGRRCVRDLPGACDLLGVCLAAGRARGRGARGGRGGRPGPAGRAAARRRGPLPAGRGAAPRLGRRAARAGRRWAGSWSARGSPGPPSSGAADARRRQPRRRPGRRPRPRSGGPGSGCWRRWGLLPPGVPVPRGRAAGARHRRRRLRLTAPSTAARALHRSRRRPGPAARPAGGSGHGPGRRAPTEEAPCPTRLTRRTTTTAAAGDRPPRAERVWPGAGRPSARRARPA